MDCLITLLNISNHNYFFEEKMQEKHRDQNNGDPISEISDEVVHAIAGKRNLKNNMNTIK
jgi:hypothetical protein